MPLVTNDCVAFELCPLGDEQLAGTPLQAINTAPLLLGGAGVTGIDASVTGVTSLTGVDASVTDTAELAKVATGPAGGQPQLSELDPALLQGALAAAVSARELAGFAASSGASGGIGGGGSATAATAETGQLQWRAPLAQDQQPAAAELLPAPQRQQQQGPPPQLQRSAPPAEVQLQQQAPCVRIDTHEGLVFELNNRVPHRVANRGDTERVHLVIDVSEEPRERVALAPGSVCSYSPAGMECVGTQAPAGPAAAGGPGHGPVPAAR